MQCPHQGDFHEISRYNKLTIYVLQYYKIMKLLGNLMFERHGPFKQKKISVCMIL